MNIVIINHGRNSRDYLFSVPDSMMLSGNDYVLVKTIYGEQVGRCTCDSFHVAKSPLRTLMKAYGATEPLAPVIGRLELHRWERSEYEDDR